MKNGVLTEAVFALKTFKLMEDVKAFTEEEAKAIREERATVGKRIEKLVAEMSDPLLKEDVAVVRTIGREIVAEAIRHERLTILEAASGQSVGQMVDQMHGMVAALGVLAPISETLTAVAEHKATQAAALAADLEDLQGAGMQREFKAAMPEFQKLFTDVSVITKACIAISDSLTQGKLGEILQPVFAWVQRSKKAATSMLDTLSQYDAQVGKSAGDVPMKQGYLSKMFSKKAPTAGGSDLAGQVKAAIDEIVRTKAPGAARAVQELGAEMLQRPLKQVMLQFKQFDAAVARNVDTDFLANMTKSSFGSALKGLMGGFLSGRGVGVGMK